MANITKLLVMAFGLIALYAVSVVAECGTAKSSLTNVTVGTPFNIKLSEGQDCIKPESYDQISLLLNGMDTGIHPLGCDPVTKEMTFTIEKKEGSEPLVNNAVWKVILGQPWNSVQTNFQRELRYTITQSADSAEVKILGSGILKLLLLSTGYSLIGIVLVATLWGVLIYLGCESGMLRDEGNQGSTLRDRTFSLGRVQMAWWFGIVMPDDQRQPPDRHGVGAQLERTRSEPAVLASPRGIAGDAFGERRCARHSRRQRLRRRLRRPIAGLRRLAGRRALPVSPGRVQRRILRR